MQRVLNNAFVQSSSEVGAGTARFCMAGLSMGRNDKNEVIGNSYFTFD